MLKTDWTRIGLSGATIDGRVIPAEWLKQAAKNYNTDVYTANLNYEHRSYYGNFGQVVELKTEEENGKTALYAKIRPDADLLYLNKQGNKLATSMELIDKFSDTGEAYLTGLAVTDNPSSLGTQQFNFTRKDQSQVFISEPSEVGTFKEDSTSDDDSESELNLFSRLANKLGFKVVEDDQADDSSDDDTEAKALFTQLKTAIESIKAPDLASLFSKEEGTKLQENFTALQDENKSLKAEHESLKEKFSSLETKLAEALKEPPVTDPEHNSGSVEEFQKCY